MLFSASYSRVKPRFTVGKRIGVWNYHATRTYQKRTHLPSVVYENNKNQCKDSQKIRNKVQLKTLLLTSLEAPIKSHVVFMIYFLYRGDNWISQTRTAWNPTFDIYQRNQKGYIKSCSEETQFIVAFRLGRPNKKLHNTTLVSPVKLQLCKNAKNWIDLTTRQFLRRSWIILVIRKSSKAQVMASGGAGTRVCKAIRRSEKSIWTLLIRYDEICLWTYDIDTDWSTIAFW